MSVVHVGKRKAHQIVPPRAELADVAPPLAGEECVGHTIRVLPFHFLSPQFAFCKGSPSAELRLDTAARAAELTSARHSGCFYDMLRLPGVAKGRLGGALAVAPCCRRPPPPHPRTPAAPAVRPLVSTPAVQRSLRHSLQHARLPQRGATPVVVAVAADFAPPSPEQTRGNAVRLAVETLRPDWPLLAFTCLALVATIAFTLAFPLAIGEVRGGWCGV